MGGQASAGLGTSGEVCPPQEVALQLGERGRKEKKGIEGGENIGSHKDLGLSQQNGGYTAATLGWESGF